MIDDYPEVVRYFCPLACVLVVCREDGTTWTQRVGEDWKLKARKKANVPLETWKDLKRRRVASLPHWARQVRELPAFEDLERWVLDSGCETPSGQTVEPDGKGPDGEPSWLVALGLM